MTLLFDEAASATQAPHNLYFAIRPDAAAAQAACALGRAAGQVMDPERLHVSLYSLGMHQGFPRQLVAEAAGAAGGIRQPAFLVALDRMATWGRGRGPLPVVAWAEDGVTGVRELHGRLHAAVAPMAPWRRRKATIEPHLSLWRADARAPVTFMPPIRWWVREFVLLDSRYGEGRHKVLDRFALAG